MYITRIEETKGKRFRVFGDDNFLFALYAKELKQFQMKESAWIEEDTVTYILKDIIYKRARERALYLLEKRPMSTSMLKDKLIANDYPKNIICLVIDFLTEYHYLDDEEYLRMYVASYSNKKSKRQLQYDLLRKGISKDLVEQYFAENLYSEQDCFEKQFTRYTRGKDLQNLAVRQKTFAYFYRKGFSSELINNYMKSSLD